MEALIASDLAGRLRLRLSRETAFGARDCRRLEEELKRRGEVEFCRYNRRTRGLLILYPAGPERRGAVLALVAGFQAAGGPWPGPEEAEPSPWTPLWRRLFKKILPPPVRLAWTVVAALPHLARGLKALFTARLNVDLLDAAALIVCFLRRDFKAAGTLLFFFSLSRHLESWTRRRSRASLFRSLADRPEKVWLRTEDGRELLVGENELNPGCLVLVRAGGLIPVDGLVVEGEALVNQASLTGEALPSAKRPGGAVLAGTSVQEGELVIKAVQVGRRTRLQALVRIIEEAEASQAGLQGRAEHLADAIVPFSFLLSGLVLALTRDWIKAGNIFLVDYSCAIRLATPLAVLSALREGHEHGLLIKGGRYFEEIAAADTIVFDKTGTLTEARPQVASVQPFNGFSRAEALRLAACLEEHFPHPVGRAVVRQARLEDLRHEEEHTDVRYVVAHGISSTWRERPVLLGSRHFVVDDNQIPLTALEDEAATQETRQGHSLVYLAIGGRLAALVAIRDQLRPGVGELLAALKADGLNRAVMLTGDVEATAAALAQAIGFEEYRARLLPDEKSAYVAELIRDGRRVIMVGDGVNDSAALARAQVGLALNDGSALARDVANVLILNGRLDTLLTARRLARAVMERLHGQYRLIVAANTVFLGLGLAGLAGPGLTALLHNATTALVAYRGTRPFLKPEVIE